MARDDFYASPFGAIYSAYMERPRLSRLISRTVWGGDTGRYYESMGTIAEVPDGGTVVDCPCGGGPALRSLHPDSAIRYIAVDLSPSMIRRAGERALARGLGNVELIEADATEIPAPSASVDLFLSFWGLHCFPDPRAALAEAARLLKPGGRLVGSSFVLGRNSLRQRLLVRSGSGDFGRVSTQAEIESWLTEAGFDSGALTRSGPMMFFDGVRKRA